MEWLLVSPLSRIWQPDFALLSALAARFLPQEIALETLPAEIARAHRFLQAAARANQDAAIAGYWDVVAEPPTFHHGLPILTPAGLTPAGLASLFWTHNENCNSRLT